MRFGTWRGGAPLLAIALAAVFAAGGFAPSRARAGIISHTIPREVVAVDVNNGGEYFAPPVPNGCYAKDPVGDAVGAVNGAFGSLCGLLKGCCPGCHGSGCDQCGGSGKCGHCKRCCGLGNGGGLCNWRGLLHGHGDDCGGGLCSPQHPAKVCAPVGHASTVCASVQSTPQASAQSICSKPGCLLKMRHFHRLGKGCSACGGNGCGLCHGGLLSGKLCGSCHGAGCPLCGGSGLGHGSGLCSQLLGSTAGMIGKLFHIGEIEYFVGPGGPVPLTPGYVPYVVSTRSPRDYFAFPPFSDLDP
jgi:hypothetical protein